MSVLDQLLILGNGFDLQCGLASSFKDFETPREQLIHQLEIEYLSGKPAVYNAKNREKEKPAPLTLKPYSHYEPEHLERTLSDDFSNRGITVWDLILVEDKRIRTWYDVESCIKDWLLNHPDGSQHTSENQLSAVKERCVQLQQALNTRIPNKDQRNLIQDYRSDRQFYRMPIDAQVATLLYRRYHEPDSDDAWIMRAMMEELHHLEAAFSEYMKIRTRGNLEYRRRAITLLRCLIDDQLADRNNLLYDDISRLDKNISPKNSIGSVRILDFNYTNPIRSISNAPALINIHGNIHGKSTIFGIDSNSVDTNATDYRELLKFTKTYRLMALGKGPKTRLVHPHVTGRPGSETDVIKFFGHSLGDPDYSYFQAIFDEVDLYGSDTRLIFYYNQNRLNEGRKEEAAQEEMFEKVSRLITTYGQTLDNKDHGRNLMHKLLLENRLRVVQAPGCMEVDKSV